MSAAKFSLLNILACAWLFAATGCAKKNTPDFGLLFVVEPMVEDGSAKTPSVAHDLAVRTAEVLRRRLEVASNVFVIEVSTTKDDLVTLKVDGRGVTPDTVKKDVFDYVVIKVGGAGQSDYDALKDIIMQEAKLEFRMVHTASEAALQRIKAGGEPEFGWVEMPYREIGAAKREEKNSGVGGNEEKSLLVRNRADLEGGHVEKAGVAFGQRGYIVTIELDAAGAKTFDEIAAKHEREQMAIVIDGVIISAPSLQSTHYGGKAEISSGRSNGFTENDARTLAAALQNPLVRPLRLVESSGYTSTPKK